MKKRLLPVVGMVFLALISSLSCSSLGGGNSQKNQFSPVVRGDMVIKVSGTGNIQASEDRQLYFSTAGKIDKINVQEGDKVTAGEQLASLQTNDLDLAVTQAKVGLSQAEIAVSKAENDVTQAQLAVSQAQYNVDSAEYSLNNTESIYLFSDINAAEGAVADAEKALQDTQAKLKAAAPGTESYTSWQKAVYYAELRLQTAKSKLNAMLGGIDTDQIKLKKEQIAVNQQALEQQKAALVLAQQSVDVAKQSQTLAQQTLDRAQQRLTDTTITAPFSGIITDVYVHENDTVTSAVPAFRIIDASHLELDLDIDEVDIAQVTVGDPVNIDLDALPGKTFTGNVTSIREIPRKEGGVILYSVKTSITAPAGSGIRDGMSANGDIILKESRNTLMVPSQAVQKNAQGQEFVKLQVDAKTGTTEDRVVTTGLSDGFQTEITSGLKEGDKVLDTQQ